LPLAWIAIQPPLEDAPDPAGDYCRALVPALAVLETLQIYPVAGSQLSLAALLLVPVGAISLGDGLRHVGRAAWVGPAALAASVGAFLVAGFISIAAFQSGAPSGLSGAESLRLPSRQGANLRALVEAIDSGCSSFITYPGMNSLYVWTGHEPATPLRYPVWWLLPDVRDQQSIVQQLDGQSHLCVVKNQTIVDFWAQGRPVPKQPLVDFIDQNFVVAGTYGDYQLLVRG
jgi:hypothetical protein